MACHICKRTGIRTCNPDEADIQCEICGFCEREAIRKAAEELCQKKTSNP